MKPTAIVVNIRSGRYDVYCGRAGKGEEGYWGNPYRIEGMITRAISIAQYRSEFGIRVKTDPVFLSRLGDLRIQMVKLAEGGKPLRLGCFCAPDACHASVIAEYLNGLV